MTAPPPTAASDEAPAGFGLPRTARLIRMREFRRVYGRGRRVHGRALTVVGLARHRPGHRLGLAVSKENGRAVRRNKIKRIFREAFRLERPTLPGAFDLVLIPKPRDGHFPLDEVRTELVELVAELLRRGPRQPQGSGRGRRSGRRRSGGSK